jgi:hypothetical protein
MQWLSSLWAGRQWVGVLALSGKLHRPIFHMLTGWEAAVTWIRSPWWDGFWILSGLPVGLSLLLMPPHALLVFFTVAVLLETGHSFSPIVLAWSHEGFRRQVILGRPWKTIALPSAIFAVTISIGAAISLGFTSLTYGRGNLWRVTDWTNPFPIVMWIYWLWNIYHFGMQNFGVIQLYRRNGSRNRPQRLVDKYGCLAVTAFGMAALPALTHSYQVGLVCFAVLSFNHWMTAIGLCSTVSGRGWLFIAGMLLLGSVGFVWMTPTSVGNMIRVVPVVICARIGLGFVHFLYDRWIWKLSDPQVRATIGQDLFPRSRSRRDDPALANG